MKFEGAMFDIFKQTIIYMPLETSIEIRALKNEEFLVFVNYC